jgi:VWFA-related protein
MLSLLCLLLALESPYKEFLERDGYYLILPREKETFLKLGENYQRDLFIEEFWKRRDPFPDTPENEFKEVFLDRLTQAEALYGFYDPRTRMAAIYGAPDELWKINCPDLYQPAEVWGYKHLDVLKGPAYLLFYQKYGLGSWTLFNGFSLDGLSSEEGSADEFCFEKIHMEKALAWTQSATADGTLGMLLQPPEVDLENVGDIFRKTTYMPEGVAPLKVAASYRFHPTPGPKTLVEGTCLVDDPEVEGVEVTGEFLRQGKVWATFKFRYQFPPPREGLQPATFLAEVFPSSYELRLKILSGDGKKGVLLKEKIDVPALEAAAPDMKAAVAPPAFALQGVNAQVPASGLLRVSVPPVEGVDKVRFLLDGEPLGIKNRPPFSLEVDLGTVPLPHTLAAVGLDALGKETARDSLVLNQGMDSFITRIVEPSGAFSPGAAVPFKAQVVVPQNRVVVRLSVYQGDDLLAELFAPPWGTVLKLNPAQPPLIKAVTELDDGRKTEDVTILSASPFGEKLKVNTVHLYVTVTDAGGKPVPDLATGEFEVLEDGETQKVLEFERAENLPVNLCFLIDSSDSMDKSLFIVKKAVEVFINDNLTSRDAAFLVDFDTIPRLLVPFISRKEVLLAALGSVTVDGSTALYDAVIFALYHFQGRSGRNAVILLTDGKDTASRFSFDDTLKYIRKSGAILYGLALNIGFMNLEVKAKLLKMAEASGGRLFSISNEEIPGTYAAIGRELRSQYHLVYVSSHTGPEFRKVQVKVKGGQHARTIAGYFP